MISKCPVCGKYSNGRSISTKESSTLRSAFKVYYSLLVPIPIIGSKIGAKIYDLCSSSHNNFYRFICDDCICSWVSSNENNNLKIGGCEKLLFYYNEETFIFGSIRDKMFIIQTQDKDTLVAYVGENDQVKFRHYMNGLPDTGQTRFGKIKLNTGLYIGEFQDQRPEGWGIMLQNNGYLLYGEWENGLKNGILFSCDYDGKDLNVSYWSKGKNIMNVKG